MTSEKRTKLNKLLQNWPYGTVGTALWLRKKGISQQLYHLYEQNKWIQRIGHGAFIRHGDTVEWLGGLYSIQTQLGLSVYVGGKTALLLQGYAHFIPQGSGYLVSTYGSKGEKLPLWFTKHKWDVKMRHLISSLFRDCQDLGLTSKVFHSFEVRMAAPERAMMEVLSLVPSKESFEEASLLMEGLTSLRPKLVEDLLKRCKSIKVKRAFMLLAEHYNHPWVRKLNLSQVNFGSGKRVMVKKGRLDPKYKITVPKNFGEDMMMEDV